jgi:predicted HicB family RNase H-like nuclease
MLSYKGYSGTVKFDADEEIFHGEVSGLRDVVTFQGYSVREIKQAFRDSIDDYLELCQETGRSPDRPFSGRLIVRMPPDLHRALHNLAAADQVSLNRVIVGLLETSLNPAGVPESPASAGVSATG